MLNCRFHCGIFVNKAAASHWPTLSSTLSRLESVVVILLTHIDSPDFLHKKSHANLQYKPTDAGYDYGTTCPSIGGVGRTFKFTDTQILSATRIWQNCCDRWYKETSNKTEQNSFRFNEPTDGGLNAEWKETECERVSPRKKWIFHTFPSYFLLFYCAVPLGRNWKFNGRGNEFHFENYKMSRGLMGRLFRVCLRSV